MKLAGWAVVAMLWSPLAGVVLLGGSDEFTSRELALVLKSLATSLATGVLATLLGFAVALRVSRLRGRAAMSAMALLAGAVAIPVIVLASGAMVAIGRVSPNLQHGLPPTILVQSFALATLSALIFIYAIRSLPQGQVEASVVLLPPDRGFRGVLLPMLAPAVAASACVCALLSLADFTVPSLFASKTYAVEILADLSVGRGGGVTLLPVLLIAALLTIAPAKWLSMQVGSHGPTYRGAIEAARSSSAVLALLFSAVFGALFVALMAEASSARAPISGVVAASLDIASSLKFALGSAALCTALAVLARPILDKSVSWIAWSAVLVPLVFPAPVVGEGLARFASSSGLDFLAHPVLAQALRSAPVVVLVFVLATLRIDRTLIEAAQVFAKSARDRLALSTALALPGLVLGSTLAFLLSLGDLGATLLVVPPGESTVVIRLYNLLHYGSAGDSAALSLAISLIVALSVLLGLAAVPRRSYGRTP